jgi:hypothetical protein
MSLIDCFEFRSYPDNKPEVDSICLCKTPEWNNEGYQVARFNGKKFDFDGSPNDMLEGCVEGFIVIED